MSSKPALAYAHAERRRPRSLRQHGAPHKRHSAYEQTNADGSDHAEEVLNDNARRSDDSADSGDNIEFRVKAKQMYRRRSLGALSRGDSPGALDVRKAANITTSSSHNRSSHNRSSHNSGNSGSSGFVNTPDKWSAILQQKRMQRDASKHKMNLANQPKSKSPSSIERKKVTESPFQQRQRYQRSVSLTGAMRQASESLPARAPPTAASPSQSPSSSRNSAGLKKTWRKKKSISLHKPAYSYTSDQWQNTKDGGGSNSNTRTYGNGEDTNDNNERDNKDGDHGQSSSSLPTGLWSGSAHRHYVAALSNASEHDQTPMASPTATPKPSAHKSSLSNNIPFQRISALVSTSVSPSMSTKKPAPRSSVVMSTVPTPKAIRHNLEKSSSDGALDLTGRRRDTRQRKSMIRPRKEPPAHQPQKSKSSIIVTSPYSLKKRSSAGAPNGQEGGSTPKSPATISKFVSQRRVRPSRRSLKEQASKSISAPVSPIPSKQQMLTRQIERSGGMPKPRGQTKKSSMSPSPSPSPSTLAARKASWQAAAAATTATPNASKRSVLSPKPKLPRSSSDGAMKPVADRVREKESASSTAARRVRPKTPSGGRKPKAVSADSPFLLADPLHASKVTASATRIPRRLATSSSFMASTAVSGSSSNGESKNAQRMSSWKSPIQTITPQSNKVKATNGMKSLPPSIPALQSPATLVKQRVAASKERTYNKQTSDGVTSNSGSSGLRSFGTSPAREQFRSATSSVHSSVSISTDSFEFSNDGDDDDDGDREDNSSSSSGSSRSDSDSSDTDDDSESDSDSSDTDSDTNGGSDSDSDSDDLSSSDDESSLSASLVASTGSQHRTKRKKKMKGSVHREHPKSSKKGKSKNGDGQNDRSGPVSAPTDPQNDDQPKPVVKQMSEFWRRGSLTMGSPSQILPALEYKMKEKEQRRTSATQSAVAAESKGGMVASSSSTAETASPATNAVEAAAAADADIDARTGNHADTQTSAHVDVDEQPTSSSTPPSPVAEKRRVPPRRTKSADTANLLERTGHGGSKHVRPMPGRRYPRKRLQKAASAAAAIMKYTNHSLSTGSSHHSKNVSAHRKPKRSKQKDFSSWMKTRNNHYYAKTAPKRDVEIIQNLRKESKVLSMIQHFSLNPSGANLDEYEYTHNAIFYDDDDTGEFDLASHEDRQGGTMALNSGSAHTFSSTGISADVSMADTAGAMNEGRGAERVRLRRNIRERRRKTKSAIFQKDAQTLLQPSDVLRRTMSSPVRHGSTAYESIASEAVSMSKDEQKPAATEGTQRYSEQQRTNKGADTDANANADDGIASKNEKTLPEAQDVIHPLSPSRTSKAMEHPPFARSPIRSVSKRRESHSDEVSFCMEDDVSHKMDPLTSPNPHSRHDESLRSLQNSTRSLLLKSPEASTHNGSVAVTSHSASQHNGSMGNSNDQDHAIPFGPDSPVKRQHLQVIQDLQDLMKTTRDEKESEKQRHMKEKMLRDLLETSKAWGDEDGDGNPSLTVDEVSDIVAHINLCEQTNTPIRWDLINDIVFPDGIEEEPDQEDDEVGETQLQDPTSPTKVSKEAVANAGGSGAVAVAVANDGNRNDSGKGEGGDGNDEQWGELNDVGEQFEDAIDSFRKQYDLNDEEMAEVVAHLNLCEETNTKVRWDIIHRIIYPEHSVDDLGTPAENDEMDVANAAAAVDAEERQRASTNTMRVDEDDDDDDASWFSIYVELDDNVSTLTFEFDGQEADMGKPSKRRKSKSSVGNDGGAYSYEPSPDDSDRYTDDGEDEGDGEYTMEETRNSPVNAAAGVASTRPMIMEGGPLGLKEETAAALGAAKGWHDPILRMRVNALRESSHSYRDTKYAPSTNRRSGQQRLETKCVSESSGSLDDSMPSMYDGEID